MKLKIVSILLNMLDNTFVFLVIMVPFVITSVISYLGATYLGRPFVSIILSITAGAISIFSFIALHEKLDDYLRSVYKSIKDRRYNQA